MAELPNHLIKVDIEKYSNYKWCELPYESLLYIYESYENYWAYEEIKRRKNCSIEDQYVDFGKYLGKKWIDLDDGYLEWIILNIDEKKELAKKSLKFKEEKYNEDNIENMLISFGKHLNAKWIDLNFEYLKWITENYDKFSNEYKNAQCAIEYKLKKLNLNECDLDIFNESISFGKFKGTKWIDLDLKYLKWITENIDNLEYLLYAKKVIKHKLEEF